MSKIVPALALVGLLTLSMGSAAQAAPDYPATQPPTVSSSTVVPGETVVFTASGFTPGEIIDVTATLNGADTASLMGAPAISLGGGMSMSRPMIRPAVTPVAFTTVAAADGSFSASVELSEVGTYTLKATGQTSGKTAVQTVTVIAGVDAAAVDSSASVANGANEGGLAYSGFDVATMAWAAVGALALLAGIATVVTARRRNA